MRKALVINGSPSMDRGNTALILNPFLGGMKRAGASVDVLYTKKLRINACCGQFNCWHKTPGKCWQEDGMQEAYPKLREADIWVFAAPLYVDGFPGPVKMLLDRILPLVEPFIHIEDGRCRHSLRNGSARQGKIVLVSNCGFWEIEHFDPLIAHTRAICKNVHRGFAGALLRPHGPALGGLVKMGAPLFLYEDILKAAEEAGRQLIAEGKMLPKTTRAVSRALLPRGLYVAVANRDSKKKLGER
jgi:multimeric flavodoxin WrbA